MAGSTTVPSVCAFERHITRAVLRSAGFMLWMALITISIIGMNPYIAPNTTFAAKLTPKNSSTTG